MYLQSFRTIRGGLVDKAGSDLCGALKGNFLPFICIPKNHDGSPLFKYFYSSFSEPILITREYF